MSDNTSSASSAGQQYYARKMLEMRELLKTPEQKYLSSRPHSKTQASKKTELLEQQAGQSSSSGIDKKKNSGPLGPASVNEPNIRKKPQPKEEDKLPPLRFSPMKERYGNRLSTVGSSLNRTTIENKGKSVESKSPPRSPSHSPTKSQRSDMYAWRNSVPRKKVRVTSRSIKPPVYRSRIPVASRPESILQEDIEDTPTPVARMESMAQEGTVSDQGSKDQEICSDNPSPSSDQFSADGPSPRAPKTYNSHVLSPAVEPIIFGERETISDLRKQFLQALGIEEVSLPSLSAYLMNVNFNSVLKDRLREIKIQEMFQRISVVKLLHTSSRYHGANENELGCVKGWLDDLMEELWMIECEKKQPTKVWFDQIYRWLWSRHHEEGSDPSQYDVSPSDELYVLFNAAPLRVLAAKKEHELFNLRDTGVELMRNGFRNKEKKMIEYWARLHGVQCPPSACGEEVIGIYMRKLTRWDKVELKDSSLQRRRMWYL